MEEVPVRYKQPAPVKEKILALISERDLSSREIYEEISKIRTIDFDCTKVHISQMVRKGIVDKIEPPAGKRWPTYIASLPDDED